MARMTTDEPDALRWRLGRLRGPAREEIALRLREARAYGDGSNNDEYHAVREDQMVLEARIASLERAIARTVAVDPGDVRDGCATVGSTVSVQDLDSGTTSSYAIAGTPGPTGQVVSAASPMGQALVGARAGTVVTADLPRGRRRRLLVLTVEPPFEQAA